MKSFGDPSKVACHHLPLGLYGGKAHNLSKLCEWLRQDQIKYNRKGLMNKVFVPSGFAIECGELPERSDIDFLIENICNGYPVAVRSSAVGEDGVDNSFAGQFDTFLNQSNLAEVLESINLVKESAFNTRSQSYQQELDQPISGMAVVVQSMVKATVAGVMFTAEPVESNVNLIAIESVTGFGDKLVSGEASPDLWVFDKKTGVLVEKEIIDKPSLNRDSLSVLIRIGKRIEKFFGSPQDIEWAFDRDHLYILQSRPITTLDQNKRS